MLFLICWLLQQLMCFHICCVLDGCSILSCLRWKAGICHLRNMCSACGWFCQGISLFIGKQTVNIAFSGPAVADKQYMLYIEAFGTDVAYTRSSCRITRMLFLRFLIWKTWMGFRWSISAKFPHKMAAPVLARQGSYPLLSHSRFVEVHQCLSYG